MVLRSILEPLQAYDAMVTAWRENRVVSDQHDELTWNTDIPVSSSASDVHLSDEERLDQLVRRLFDEEYRSYDAERLDSLADTPKQDVLENSARPDRSDRSFRPIQVTAWKEFALDTFLRFSGMVDRNVHDAMRASATQLAHRWKKDRRKWDRHIASWVAKRIRDLQPVRSAEPHISRSIQPIEDLRAVFGQASIPGLVELTIAERAMIEHETWESMRQLALRPFLAPQPCWYCGSIEAGENSFGPRLSSQSSRIEAR